jgi:tetratricopeptide (TPR) repeat protein
MISNFLLCAMLLTSSGTNRSAAPVQRTHSSSKAFLNFEQLSGLANEARDRASDDEAIGLYQQALKLRPNWDQGLWSLGGLLYEKERYREARDVLRRFVADVPVPGPGWALLGMSEFQTREYSRALDHLQHSMAQGMGDRREMEDSVFYFVSVLLTRFERYDDSMSLLMAMVKSGQDTAALVEPIGLAALRLPLLPAEIPQSRSELIRMAGEATLALESQRQEEAKQLFDRMVAMYPNEPGVHFLRGAFLMDLRPEEAVQEMERELAVSPSSVPARLRLAEQLTKQQQYDRALKLALEALKLEPGNALAHMVQGEALAAKGATGDAIGALETASTYAPETVRIHWDLLRAYSAAGRTEDVARERKTIQELVKTQH